MNEKLPFEVGKSYFIRTVTYHVLGKVKDTIGGFILMEKASWIADSGRFGNALAKGELGEVEYAGDAIVNASAITDAYPWPHDLPTKTK